MDNGNLQIKNTASYADLDMMYPFYSEEDFYKSYIVGKWVDGTNHLTFSDNWTYERTYEHFLAAEGAWARGKVSMDFVYMTLTYDDNWDKEEVESEGNFIAPITYCVVLEKDSNGEIKLKLTDIEEKGKVYHLSRE